MKLTNSTRCALLTAGVGAFATYNPDIPPDSYPVPDTRPKSDGVLDLQDEFQDLVHEQEVKVKDMLDHEAGSGRLNFSK